MLNTFFFITLFLLEQPLSMYPQTTVQVTFKDITILLGNK